MHLATPLRTAASCPPHEVGSHNQRILWRRRRRHPALPRLCREFERKMAAAQAELQGAALREQELQQELAAAQKAVAADRKRREGAEKRLRRDQEERDAAAEAAAVAAAAQLKELHAVVSRAQGDAAVQGRAVAAAEHEAAVAATRAAAFEGQAKQAGAEKAALAAQLAELQALLHNRDEEHEARAAALQQLLAAVGEEAAGAREDAAAARQREAEAERAAMLTAAAAAAAEEQLAQLQYFQQQQQQQQYHTHLGSGGGLLAPSARGLAPSVGPPTPLGALGSPFSPVLHGMGGPSALATPPLPHAQAGTAAGGAPGYQGFGREQGPSLWGGCSLFSGSAPLDGLLSPLHLAPASALPGFAAGSTSASGAGSSSGSPHSSGTLGLVSSGGTPRHSMQSASITSSPGGPGVRHVEVPPHGFTSNGSGLVGYMSAGGLSLMPDAASIWR